jgi:uncharacterized protein
MPGRLNAIARSARGRACLGGFFWLAVLAAGGIRQIPSVARADAAAGSAAFERGDYVRAMAEWASAAQRGDSDAAFGLGMLYERGDGDLQQDYRQADRWYERAAEQGNIGAEYRLALIWSAGGENFPADLVEAYKWILLASENGLATDVKAELAAVLSQSERSEGERRAAAWKQAHVAGAGAPAPAPAQATPAAGSTTPSANVGAGALPPASGAAPVTTAKRGGGGCPGWPFPTLPCTEQFPALGGGAPAPAPAPQSTAR